MRYIELNPVRAGIVSHPSDYVWSSYRSNAMSHVNEVLQPHELYLLLGATPPARQSAYRDLFRHALDQSLVEDIRATVQTGTPLGNNRFREQIELALQCRVGQSRRGRPVKTGKGY